MYFKLQSKREVNAGSMADIAFLLLIFFLVTTQIETDKGLQLRLPPDKENPIEPVNERNLFKIQINSMDRVLVENEKYVSIDRLSEDVMNFINNYGKDQNLSNSPDKAIVSIKTDRGTSYFRFIEILDKVQGAYYELRAVKVGLTTQQYRSLDLSKPDELTIYYKGKEGLPMQISIAEPGNVNP